MVLVLNAVVKKRWEEIISRTFLLFEKFSGVRILTTFYTAKNDHQWVILIFLRTIKPAGPEVRRSLVPRSLVPERAERLVSSVRGDHSAQTKGNLRGFAEVVVGAGGDCERAAAKCGTANATLLA